MREIPAAVGALAAEVIAQVEKDDPGYSRHDLVVAAILAERDRCINKVIDAANAGKYTPLSEFVAAIRGDQ